MRRTIFTGFVVTALALHVRARAQDVRVTVDPGEVARRNVPVTAAIDDPALAQQLRDARPDAKAITTLMPEGGASTVLAHLDAKPGQAVLLRWIEPELQPGKPKTYTLRPATDGIDAPSFQFKPGDGFRDLVRAGNGVYRHMTRFDAADHVNTFKTFHHVFALDDSGTFITNGPGSDEWGQSGKDIRFPHHRGLFFAYNKTPYGDFWHGKDGVSQRHIYYDEMHEFAGPVAARELGVLTWVAKDGKPVIRDARRLSTWAVDRTMYVLDIDVTLESLTGDAIALGGDAQHAGFHFRAANEVGQEPATKPTAGATTRRGTGGGAATYTRPASAAGKGNDVWADCPWVQCVFTVKGKPYAITQMNGPANAQPTVFSTRPYGRFGAFVNDQTVAPDKPLKFSYRFIIRDGSAAPDAKQLDAEYQDWITPAKVRFSK